jgi:GH35 family endo-1,4-beta-xylanase
MTKLLDARVPVHTGGDAVGVADDNTWLSEFTSMREDFPLLFDDRHATKASYDSVMDW